MLSRDVWGAQTTPEQRLEVACELVAPLQELVMILSKPRHQFELIACRNANSTCLAERVGFRLSTIVDQYISCTSATNSG